MNTIHTVLVCIISLTLTPSALAKERILTDTKGVPIDTPHTTDAQ